MIHEKKQTINKIPCSISLLTFNSEEGLQTCLESLKDFAEIIVCDGNSTDRTREIAGAFGARVIKQYDTDEPNVPCAMDKAAVRERAMSASTLPWRFFMDADDTLSRDAVEEIGRIVHNPHPTHLVWRMPTRIFIEGKEIKHEATYPSYQTRLVHKSVGAHFRGHVHDRLAFDEKKFTLGTMSSFYNFGWPQERVANYWKYMKTYAQRELLTSEFKNFFGFLRWGIYFRLRVIAGYVLWRLPAMYVRYGFQESMPLNLELTIVRYHLHLLFGSICKYITTRAWSVLLVETLRGKDLNRILSNSAVRGFEAYGRVLDIGGREGKGSYWRYLNTRRWHRVVTADIDPASHPDVVIDLEKEALPFPEAHFDTILMFNLLEHLDAREAILKELHRILRPQGTLLCVVPFLVGAHPDPHDYVRFTDEGLRALFSRAGFEDINITLVGRGPLTASYYQSEFLWPRIIKLFVIPMVLALDALVLRMRPRLRVKFPLSYVLAASPGGLQ